MRIKTIRIQNFRSFSDETINFENYTCFVGANGAGKSTILSALNVFFRETSNSTDVISLKDEDFHHKKTENPIVITLTFGDLSAQALTELSDYARNGELIVTSEAKFDVASGKAPVKQFGNRMGIDDFRRYFESDKAAVPAAVLKTIYAELKQATPELPNATSKEAMATALRTYEQEHTELCILIPSEDEFYGIRGTARLRAFIQWIYIPAVKDASDEESEGKDTALGKLLSRTVRTKVNFREDMATLQIETEEKYRALVAASQGALDDISKSLTQRLAQWSHPEVNLRVAWQHEQVKLSDPSAKVIAGESGFEGELARFGHGFQRSYLLAILQELASTSGDEQPTLILGCEEPELYQHPPQAKHLAQVLRTLSIGNSQVALTTHSPYFVSGDNFENVRLVRKTDGTGAANCHATTHAALALRHSQVTGEQIKNPSATMALINEILKPSLNEMFFARRLIFVEGPADAAYITSWLAFTNRLEAFRRNGLHIISVEKKSNILRPLIVANQLGIPTFTIFDCDNGCDANHRQRHQNDNTALLKAVGGDATIPFPIQSILAANYACWPNTLDGLIDEELIASLGNTDFNTIKNEAEAACGNAGALSKNSTFIQHKLEIINSRGVTIATLDRLCDSILADSWA